MNAELLKLAAARNEELVQGQLEKAAFVGKTVGGVAKGLVKGVKAHPIAGGFAYVSLAPKAINPVPFLKWPMLEKTPHVKEETQDFLARAKASRNQPTDMSGRIRDPLIKQNSSKEAAMFTSDEVKAVQRISSCLEKTARGKPGAIDGEVVSKILQFGAVALGLGAGAQVGQYGISKVMARGRTRNEKKFYQGMIRADPSLHREPGAREMFRVVNRASPYLASEPIIAAATVRSMLESPALDERKLQQLLSTEKLRQDTEFPWRTGAQGGMQGIKDISQFAIE